MAKPLITPLPMPPNRQSAAAEFAARADSFLSALPAFGHEVGVAATYIDGRIAAASQIAVDAQAWATTATQQASAAAGSATNALQSFHDAMAVAAAVGDAAGMPSFAGNAGKVLAVNENETGAGWRSLPSNALGSRTVSTATPSGGADGDLWYRV